MAADYFIPTLPNDIDRTAFGSWLSGFVDGEGCFGLFMSKLHFPSANFSICLRADDRHVLELIQSYFGFGELYFSGKRRDGNQMPQLTFQIHKIIYLHNGILPHFALYPLLSKKARDLVIWRRGVEILYEVRYRKRTPIPYRKGTALKWLPSEREEFASLVQSLRETRKFK